jgi:hypothetical protein
MVRRRGIACLYYGIEKRMLVSFTGRWQPEQRIAQRRLSMHTTEEFS